MDDCLLCIFGYLPFTVIYNCIPVNKQYNKIINSELIWKSLFSDRFIVPIPSNFKSTYRDFHIMDKFMIDCLTDINTSYKNKCFGYCNSKNKPPNAIKSLTYLQALNISDCNLVRMPFEICSLTNLQSLDLAHCRLISLPENISRLTKLSHLYLDNNNLESIPSPICNLTNLKNIYLSNNKLKYISPCISQLTQLERLVLPPSSDALSIPENIKHTILLY